MSEENETFAEAVKRGKSMGLIPPSGEHQRFAKGADKVSEPLLNEKTRLGLSITAAVSIIIGLVAGGIEIGRWQEQKAAMTAHVDALEQRTGRLEDHWTETKLFMGHFSDQQDAANKMLEDQQKTLKVLLYAAGGDRKKVPADN